MENMVDMLQGFTVWHWLGIALLFLVLELLTGTTYFLWLSLAAGVTTLWMFLPLPSPWPFQWFLFSVAAIVLTLMGHFLVRPRWMKADDEKLNQRGVRLVGQYVQAVETFTHGAGRVKVRDTEWSARLTQTQGKIRAGDVLIVRSVEGVTLIVEPSEPGV